MISPIYSENVNVVEQFKIILMVFNVFRDYVPPLARVPGVAEPATDMGNNYRLAYKSE